LAIVTGGWVTREEEARAFLIAHELIEQHGDDLLVFLDAKIRQTQSRGDRDALEAWLVIREAALTAVEAYSRPLH
jgi:sulfur relay (sulfurtransferase) complex TusBCD TusD component (DsrE family)